jgi:hypothetical protein
MLLIVSPRLSQMKYLLTLPRLPEIESAVGVLDFIGIERMLIETDEHIL